MRVRHSAEPSLRRAKAKRPPALSALAALTAVVTVSALMTVPAALAAPAGASADAPAAVSATASANAGAHGCDPIDPAVCLMPFPNNWFTVADSSTATGRRVAMTKAMTPRNVLGMPVDPAEWNRSDGFSPGSMLLTRVPGIDLARSGAAPVTDIGRSLRSDAPIVIIDTATGERWPYWAELDANASSADRQALIVRPARNFREGHRYVVALRDLRDATGTRLAPPAAFEKIIGRTLPAGDPLAARQRQERAVLADLARRGVGARGLYLAWDFTVASRQGLSERLLHIRDDAFAGLGDRSPGFVVTEVTDHTEAEDPRIAREVKGYFAVPSYLDQPGGPPGSAFRLGRDGLPSRLPANTQVVPFQCEIPRSAFTAPAQAGVYGHGLLGGEGEVSSGAVKALSADHNFTFCATKWIGMSSEDVPNVVTVLADLSRFRTVADRLQQSVLDTMFLGRAMIHSKGFVSDKAFRTTEGRPLIDTGAGLVYDGNSQGGIMGGVFMATSTDARRGVLGVTGMNYSTLLNRSVDFSRYAVVYNTAYPDTIDRQLGLALIQMLWYRAETNGYAAHLTDHPLPGTPSHQVLLHVAFGDHQVSPLTAEVEARTAGVPIKTPVVAAGRNPDVVPYWGLRSIPGYPYTGSGLVVWDSGTPAPPLTNTPPAGEEYGRDPHSDPRNWPAAQRQMATFLRTGQIIDVCEGAPCLIRRTG